MHLKRERGIFMFQTHASQMIAHAACFVEKQAVPWMQGISDVEQDKSTVDQHPFIHHKGLRQAPVEMLYQLPLHQMF